MVSHADPKGNQLASTSSYLSSGRISSGTRPGMSLLDRLALALSARPEAAGT